MVIDQKSITDGLQIQLVECLYKQKIVQVV